MSEGVPNCFRHPLPELKISYLYLQIPADYRKPYANPQPGVEGNDAAQEGVPAMTGWSQTPSS